MEDFDKELEEDYQHLLKLERQADAQIEGVEARIRRFGVIAWIFVWLGMAILLGGSFVYFFMDTGMYSLNLLGDFLGGSVASLWSLAALLFIFVAFLGQKQQLIIQQKEVRYNQLELKATRVEILRQRQQLEDQNETLRRQRFENTFFQLISMHNEIVRDMDIVSESMEHETGSDCFHVIYFEFRKWVRENVDERETDHKEVMEKAWLDFYKRYESETGHYIRNLYHIVKFVNTSGLTDKLQYLKFVRSSLTSDELLVLFYNCHTILGKDKFKPLIEEFHLFKNLPTEDLISTSHLAFYLNSAFEED